MFSFEKCTIHYVYLLKYTSAWLPIALPALWLVIIGSILVMSGIPVAQAEDEGTLAHLFQLWLMVQPFLIGYFAVRHLPAAPKQGIIILCLQLATTVAACFPVLYLNF